MLEIMAFTPSWRNFRRMQGSLLAAASLIYAGAAVHAWRVLPADDAFKAQRTLVFPGFFFVLTLVVTLAAPPVRRVITRHTWISFRTGFGQSAISVVAALLVLLTLAGFIYWQTWAAQHGASFRGGVFSGYASGIGLLLAQVFLVRGLERDPARKDQIGE
jgi:hypothetical protein